MNTATAMSLDRYKDALTRIQPQLAGANQPWLVQHRNQAARRLGELGFPQRRHEAWRYTSVERLLKHDFVPAVAGEYPGIDITSLLLPQLDAYRVVLVNGRFVPALSSLHGLPPGVTVGSLKEQIAHNPILPARWLGKAAGHGNPQAQFNLGVLYKEQGRYADAASCFPRALVIFEQTLGPEHPRLAVCREEYDDLVQAMARDQHHGVPVPFGEQLEEGPACLGVEVCGRLIEYQHVGVTSQCAGDQQFLLLPARQTHEWMVAEMFGIESQPPGHLYDVPAVGRT